DYQEMMKKSGKENLDFVSLEGYIAAQVLVEGLRRAGKDLTRDKLIGGLESMSKTDVGGFAINFSKTSHNASSLVDLTIIGKNGKFFR
ncbi:MAG: ABC transporter substrate-binding protein, partial [Dechloromonas sp.]|nr:ABC transporter substrate-binding protein [Dechloromonas sp.]